MTNEQSWDTLYEQYPNLFVNKNKSRRESPMAFGIECGLGWYNILSSLCWMINQHENNIKWTQEWNAKKQKEINQDLSIEILDPEPEYFAVKFDQVKEKYGGLRAYFSGGDEYIEGLVSMAEAISYKTCEVCGNKGEANKGGWISVLCDKHREESMK